MARKTVIALCILAASTLAALPAKADRLSVEVTGPHGGIGITLARPAHYSGYWGYWKPYRYWYGRIPVHRARHKLRNRGFRGIRLLRDRGNVYVFRAFKPSRGRVRVVVSAYDGRILRVRRIGRVW